MEPSKLINDIVNAITQTPAVEKVILFGSQARGDQEPRSDYDIAVIGLEITPREWLDLCDRVENIETLLFIDLLRFDTASPKLQEKISRQGVVIYER